MRLFGLQAYRRRGRKPRKKGVAVRIFPNILKAMIPSKINKVWISDFTCIPYKEKFLYLATVMDIVITEVVGYSVLLVMQASHCHPHPDVYHLDNSKECITIIFITALIHGYLNIPSAKVSPWENGYQESFYSQFKVDLGNPERFKTVGELVYEMHHLIWNYNNARTHTALRMPPRLFAEHYQKLMENVS